MMRARELPLPDPFDVAELCRDVGRRRGRPIVLAALQLAAAGPCGLWLATDSLDYICYEEHTSRLHQQHIVLHELGHVLCGHGGPIPLEGMLAGPGTDAVRIMLARRHSGFHSGHEAEAELFAYTVLDRVARQRPPRAGGADDPAGRLARALED
jgi:Zn-dependent peptidase ImmA (M78 family)